MSVAATTWVWSLTPQQIPATERLVLLSLADYADEDGSCWPGNERIQQRTSLGERAIRNALRGLEAKQLLRMVLRPRTTPRYYLHIGTYPAPDAGLKTPGGTEGESDSKNKSLSREVSSEPIYPASGAGLVYPASGSDLPGTSCRFTRHDVPPIRQRYTKDTSEGGRASARLAPHPLPESWQPSEEDVAFASSLGLNPVTVAVRFRAHFEASGRPFASWSARWRKWCLEDAPPALVAPKGAAAGGEPAAAVVLDRDADGLTPRERALVDEFAEMVRQKVPEDNQRRIKVEGFLRNHCAPAWKVACRQVAA